MPNRRRRRLSTAMSAVAALAVASPFAYVAVCNLSADPTPAPEHHEFVRAASMTDLPNELMSALSQGLSQFGVTLPPVPSLTGATGTGLTSPGLTSPDLMSPGLTSPGLTSPGLTSPGLTSPGEVNAPRPGRPALSGLVAPVRLGIGGRLTPNCDNPCDSAPISSPGRSVMEAARTNS